jgi:hypothetical protein
MTYPVHMGNTPSELSIAGTRNMLDAPMLRCIRTENVCKVIRGQPPRAGCMCFRQDLPSISLVIKLANRSLQICAKLPMT